ncbi:hypothetical protein [Nioella nitratireducens]|uniref:hypothetical protein n=1 Tax=Nioella nitratireducens TaxID=1287720 RepID=UPI0008FD72D9|nr:hypothetical protein [Nioella nitratireducens]
MSRFSLKAAALALAALSPAAASAQSVIQLQGVQIMPNAVSGIAAQHGIRVQPGLLTVQCPAPAVRSFTARRLGGGMVRIEAEIANVGGAPYRSHGGQQFVAMRTASGAPIGQRDFVNLDPGESFVFATERRWNPASEFLEGFGVAITYDPDIRLDANPQNDDCRMADNTASLSPAEINALFR